AAEDLPEGVGAEAVRAAAGVSRLRPETPCIPPAGAHHGRVARPETPAMQPVSRRSFLAAGAVTATGLAAPATAHAADPKLNFKLGIVTYNVAKDWDLPTILRICKGVGLAAVELRTTHKHGVEPSLSKDQRKEVRQRFADAGVTCWGCGSVCEFHSPDAAVVKKQIETCKEFVQLAADIGGKGVKVRPNGLPKGVAVEKTLEQIGKALVPCG